MKRRCCDSCDGDIKQHHHDDVCSVKSILYIRLPFDDAESTGRTMDILATKTSSLLEDAGKSGRLANIGNKGIGRQQFPRDM